MKRRRRAGGDLAWGGLLVTLGLFLQLQMVGVPAGCIFARFWPILLVVLGGLALYHRKRRKKPGESNRFWVCIECHWQCPLPKKYIQPRWIN